MLIFDKFLKYTYKISLWENKCDLMGKRMDFNAYGKLNVILWEEFSYGKINVILWEKNALAFYNSVHS